MSKHYDLETRANRLQVVRDVGHLVRLQEKAALEGHQFRRGHFEATVDRFWLEQVQRQHGQMIEGVRSEVAQLNARAQERVDIGFHNGIVLERIDDNGRRTRIAVEDLCEHSARNLVLTGALVMGQRKLIAIAHSIDRGIWEANDHLGSIEEATLKANDQLDDLITVTREAGEGIERQIRVSSLEASRFLAAHVQSQTLHLEKALRVLTVALEEGADRRHRELLETLRQELLNRAQEKYQQAACHFRIGETGLCLIELENAIDNDSTHPQVWILLGRLAFKRGLPAMAKASFHRAAACAADEHKKEWAAYTDAMLRLSEVERIVGNHDEGIKILRDAQMKVSGQAPELGTILRYEELKAWWVHPTRRIDPKDMARYLREIFVRDNVYRETVATSPIWDDLFVHDPLLAFGDAPLIRLCELWRQEKWEGKQSVSFTFYCIGHDFVDVDVDLPLVPDEIDPYWVCLVESQAGKGSLDYDMEIHLEWVEAVLAETDARSPSLKEFFVGVEATVLRAYELRRAQGDAKAFEILKAFVRIPVRVDCTEEVAKEGRLYLVELELFKHDLEQGMPREEALHRIKTQLREIFKGRPELRKSVASAALFEPFFEECPWLPLGNARYVRLLERVCLCRVDATADTRDPLLWKSQQTIVQKVRRDLLEARADPERLSERDRLFMKAVAGLTSLSGWDDSIEANTELFGNVLLVSLMAQPPKDERDILEFQEKLQVVYACYPSAKEQVQSSDLFREYRALVAELQELQEYRERLARGAREREEAEALAHQQAQEEARLRAEREVQERTRLEQEREQEERARRQSELHAAQQRFEEERKHRREKQEAEERRKKRENLGIGIICLVVIAASVWSILHDIPW